MSIDEIREAFPRFEWKQYGSFIVASTEGWTLSVAVSFPEHGYLASFSGINYNLLRLPPAASYKACAIAAVKDVLQLAPSLPSKTCCSKRNGTSGSERTSSISCRRS